MPSLEPTLADVLREPDEGEVLSREIVKSAATLLATILDSLDTAQGHLDGQDSGNVGKAIALLEKAQRFLRVMPAEGARQSDA